MKLLLFLKAVRVVLLSLLIMMMLKVGADLWNNTHPQVKTVHIDNLVSKVSYWEVHTKKDIYYFSGDYSNEERRDFLTFLRLKCGSEAEVVVNPASKEILKITPCLTASK